MIDTWFDTVYIGHVRRLQYHLFVAVSVDQVLTSWQCVRVVLCASLQNVATAWKVKRVGLRCFVVIFLQRCTWLQQFLLIGWRKEGKFLQKPVQVVKIGNQGLVESWNMLTVLEVKQSNSLNVLDSCSLLEYLVAQLHIA